MTVIQSKMEHDPTMQSELSQAIQNGFQIRANRDFQNNALDAASVEAERGRFDRLSSALRGEEQGRGKSRQTNYDTSMGTVAAYMEATREGGDPALWKNVEDGYASSLASQGYNPTQIAQALQQLRIDTAARLAAQQSGKGAPQTGPSSNSSPPASTSSPAASSPPAPKAPVPRAPTIDAGQDAKAEALDPVSLGFVRPSVTRVGNGASIGLMSVPGSQGAPVGFDLLGPDGKVLKTYPTAEAASNAYKLLVRTTKDIGSQYLFMAQNASRGVAPMPTTGPSPMPSQTPTPARVIKPGAPPTTSSLGAYAPKPVVGAPAPTSALGAFAPAVRADGTPGGQPGQLSPQQLAEYERQTGDTHRPALVGDKEGIINARAMAMPGVRDWVEKLNGSIPAYAGGRSGAPQYEDGMVPAPTGFMPQADPQADAANTRQFDANGQQMGVSYDNELGPQATEFVGQAIETRPVFPSEFPSAPLTDTRMAEGRQQYAPPRPEEGGGAAGLPGAPKAPEAPEALTPDDHDAAKESLVVHLGEKLRAMKVTNRPLMETVPQKRGNEKLAADSRAAMDSLQAGAGIDEKTMNSIADRAIALNKTQPFQQLSRETTAQVRNILANATAEELAVLGYGFDKAAAPRLQKELLEKELSARLKIAEIEYQSRQGNSSSSAWAYNFDMAMKYVQSQSMLSAAEKVKLRAKDPTANRLYQIVEEGTGMNPTKPEFNGFFTGKWWKGQGGYTMVNATSADLIGLDADKAWLKSEKGARSSTGGSDPASGGTAPAKRPATVAEMNAKWNGD